jgi:hypothetical protein
MKNYLVIFWPQGLGGHHLANIISTSDKYYNNSVDLEMYFGAQKNNAHYGAFDGNYENSIILAPHFCNAEDDKIKHLQTNNQVEFLVIHMPNSNKLAWRRYNSLNGNTQVKFERSEFVFVRNDIEKIYKQQFLSMIYGGVWNTVMADDLFSDDIDVVLDQLQQNLNIKFADRPLIRKIHSRWLHNISSCLE